MKRMSEAYKKQAELIEAAQDMQRRKKQQEKCDEKQAKELQESRKRNREDKEDDDADAIDQPMCNVPVCADQEHSDKTPRWFVKGVIAGLSLNALVDCGASLSTIPLSLWKRMNEHEKRESTARGDSRNVVASGHWSFLKHVYRSPFL
eukprot:GHVS01048651.1.p2 GENE.GHVS01048651.1~~GHVS01048651.1.p2  ORF type:complete len:148 (+),score=21.97 GHVS01048651.1:537-980(+)